MGIFVFPSLQLHLLAETLQQQAEKTVKTREHGHLAIDKIGMFFTFSLSSKEP